MNIFTIIVQLNWLAILAATVAFFILGALWFTVFFGKAYIAVLGRENEPQQPPKPLFILGPLVCTFVITLAISISIQALNISTIGDAASFGLFISIGFLIPTMTNIAINPNMPHPLKYALINAPYFLIGSLISSSILVVMA